MTKGGGGAAAAEGQKAATANGGSQAELDKKSKQSQYVEGLETRFVQRCEVRWFFARRA